MARKRMHFALTATARERDGSINHGKRPSCSSSIAPSRLASSFDPKLTNCPACKLTEDHEEALHAAEEVVSA